FASFWSGNNCALHSFPTRRSSDLGMGVYGTILIIELLFIGFLIWSNRLAFKKRGYAVREKDLLYRSGILSTTTTIVPFNRIQHIDRKSTRLNSSHVKISYAVFCLK